MQVSYIIVDELYLIKKIGERIRSEVQQIKMPKF